MASTGGGGRSNKPVKRLMPMLDLCFKQEMRVVEVVGKTGDLLLVYLDRNDRDRGIPMQVTFNPKTLRFDTEPRGYLSGYTANASHQTTVVEDFEVQRETLHLLPGLSHIPISAMSPFQRHHQIQTKAHPTLPTYATVKSIGTLNEDTFTVLYMPPLTTDAMRGVRTPTGRSMPLDPTCYTSAEEAAIVPALLELWRQPDDLSKDCAVLLESEGAVALPRVRAALATERDRAKQLPALFGSLKQVAWASALRENFITEHLPMRRQQCISWPWLAGATTLNGIGEVMQELKYADDSKDWIDNRSDPYAWLQRRVENRKRTLKESPELKAILRED